MHACAIHALIHVNLALKWINTRNGGSNGLENLMRPCGQNGWPSLINILLLNCYRVTPASSINRKHSTSAESSSFIWATIVSPLGWITCKSIASTNGYRLLAAIHISDMIQAACVSPLTPRRRSVRHSVMAAGQIYIKGNRNELVISAFTKPFSSPITRLVV